MKLTPLHLAVLALAFAAAGCGDSFPKLLQAELSLVNEVADHLLKIVDEDTAKYFLDNYSEKLKITWEDVQKRKDLYMKNSELQDQATVPEILGPIIAKGGLNTPEIRAQLAQQRDQFAKNEANRDQVMRIERLLKNQEFLIEATPRIRREANALSKRLLQQMGRLDVVISRLQGQCPKLKEARESPRKIFGDGKVGLATPILPRS